MRVFKFGGASVQDAEHIRNVASILQKEGTDDCLLVISAMGKMTNAFEEVVRAYCDKKEELKPSLEYIYRFHENIVQNLFQDAVLIVKELDTLFEKLYELVYESTSADYDFMYDQIVSFGEWISTMIVSHYFLEIGIDNQWNDVRQLVKTDNSYRDAKVDWESTRRSIKERIDTKKLHIVQGFLGGDPEGNTTTLGREGSDYTAGIFAYCLHARSVTIWKDVQGVLNGDPRVFQNTQLLKQISYEEAIEMAFYGASILHPKTIQPLQNKDIPLYVRSYSDQNLEGTRVSRGVPLQPLMPCFIVKKDQILLSISTLDFSFMVEDNISHIFKLLHEFQLKVSLIQNSAISFSVCVDNKFNQFNAFLQQVQSSYKVDFEREVNLYTIRHFNEKALDEIYSIGRALLTQINKETAQIVVG